MNESPNLVDAKVKGFLGGALKYSHNIKQSYMNFAYNVVLGIIFTIICIGFLIYKYKGKLTNVEKEIKKRKEYEHVLLQLKKIETEKLHSGKSLLTNLPII